MNTTARIAAAVAAGYLLGRKRRLKLAITVGGLIAGQRVPTNPRDVSRELQKVIDGNEQLSQMSEQVRGNLTAVAKGAAAQVVTQRLERLSDSLGGGPSGDELAKDDESAENEGTRGAAAKKTAKKAPAKTAKKAPAKTAKKAPAKTAKKASAKKRSGTSGSRTRKRS